MLESFAHTIDVHGVQRIKDATNSHRKLGWGLLVLISASFLCYGLVTTLMEFIDNPIVTTYSIEPHGKIKFPQVYLCPLSFAEQPLPPNLSFEYVTEGTSTASERETGSMAMSGGSPMSSGGNSQAHAFNFAGQAMEGSDIRIVYTPEPPGPRLKRSTSLQNLGDVFIQCKFENEIVSCPDQIIEVYDVQHEKCYLVDLKGQNQTRASYGLEIIMKYPPAPDKSYHIDGVKIQISMLYDPLVLQLESFNVLKNQELH